MSEAPDPEVVELATKIFDLARQGRTEELVAYVDAGVPANLTNDAATPSSCSPLITATPTRCARCWPVAPRPTASTTRSDPARRCRLQG